MAYSHLLNILTPSCKDLLSLSLFFFFDITYILGHVSTTKVCQPWPLHEVRGGFELLAHVLSAGSRSLIKGDKLDLL